EGRGRPERPREHPREDERRSDPRTSREDVSRARDHRGGGGPQAPRPRLVPLDLVELHAFGLGGEAVAEHEQVHALATEFVTVSAGLARGAERPAAALAPAGPRAPA